MENKEQKEEEVSTPSKPAGVLKTKFEQMLEKDTMTTSDKQIVWIEHHFTTQEAYNKFYNIEE
ncbi:MAG: hypothetical protein Q8908_09105 [Bacteroidota bacterium]|nr:hypothetical protein [Bacteroidota bacterium]